MRQSTAIVICVRCLPVTLVSNIHIYSKGAVSDASIPHLNPIHQFFFCYSTEYYVYVRQGEQFQRMLSADLLIGHAGGGLRLHLQVGSDTM